MSNSIITLSGQSLQTRLRVALSEAEALESKYAEFENASSGGLGLNTKHGESIDELTGRLDSSATIMKGRRAGNKFVFGLVVYGAIVFALVFLLKLPNLLIVPIFGVPVLAYMVLSWRKVLAKKNAIHEEIKELMPKLTAYYEIPESYRYSFALNYMLGLIKAGRASTWRECADKYEAQVHRWTVEANTAEAVAYAQSAAQSAALAALLIAWS